jgi:hypothetical protein
MEFFFAALNFHEKLSAAVDSINVTYYVFASAAKLVVVTV